MFGLLIELYDSSDRLLSFIESIELNLRELGLGVQKKTHLGDAPRQRVDDHIGDQDIVEGLPGVCEGL